MLPRGPLDRRRFLSLTGTLGLLWASGCTGAATPAAGARPAPPAPPARRAALPPPASPRRVAITLDDPHLLPTPLLDPQARDARIRAALAQRRARAALFVAGKRVDSPEGAALLAAWSDAGHLIGNHSYSHKRYHEPERTLEWFQEDVLRGEAIVRGHAGFQRIFRYPFLQEGDTRDKRDGARRFLREHGYRNGHVTVGTSDWFIDERMTERLAARPDLPLAGYREFYVRHLLDRLEFYDRLSWAVLGRSIPHAVLLHHGLLPALFLGDAMDAITAEGWAIIDPREAFADPAYAIEPDTLPAGETLLWALAMQAQDFEGIGHAAEGAARGLPAMESLGL